MLFVIIGLIILLILEAHQFIDTKKFATDVEPYFRFLMEDDYNGFFL